MLKGFYYKDKSEYLDKFKTNSTELSLLGKGDGTEVMLQNIKAGETFYLQPSEVSEIMEFFYILDGVIEIEKEGKTLTKGDYFYVHHLSESIWFKPVRDVSLLYLSTQPVFKFISKAIQDLTLISRQVQDKDMYTHEHCNRVGEYSVKIAKGMNLSREKVDDITFASLFHDIGKIDVPIEILNKPSRLTNEEFEYIKKHPTFAIEYIKKTYYERTRDIIEQHHERLDGSGYPKGLKGNEIHIGAKIISVADTYDAMTTDRPYRKGLSSEIAVAELNRLKGIHYDEKVVEIFIKILKEEGKI